LSVHIFPLKSRLVTTLCPCNTFFKAFFPFPDKCCWATSPIVRCPVLDHSISWAKEVCATRKQQSIIFFILYSDLYLNQGQGNLEQIAKLRATFIGPKYNINVPVYPSSYRGTKIINRSLMYC